MPQEDKQCNILNTKQQGEHGGIALELSLSLSAHHTHRSASPQGTLLAEVPLTRTQRLPLDYSKDQDRVICAFAACFQLMRGI